MSFLLLLCENLNVLDLHTYYHHLLSCHLFTLLSQRFEERSELDDNSDFQCILIHRGGALRSKKWTMEL